MALLSGRLIRSSFTRPMESPPPFSTPFPEIQRFPHRFAAHFLFRWLRAPKGLADFWSSVSLHKPPFRPKVLAVLPVWHPQFFLRRGHPLCITPGGRSSFHNLTDGLFFFRNLPPLFFFLSKRQSFLKLASLGARPISAPTFPCRIFFFSLFFFPFSSLFLFFVVELAPSARALFFPLFLTLPQVSNMSFFFLRPDPPSFLLRFLWTFQVPSSRRWS